MVSKAVFAAYGKYVSFCDKLGFLPFRWDPDDLKIVTEVRPKNLLRSKLKKFLFFILTAINVSVMTVGTIRNLLNSDFSVLHKLKPVLETVMYWVFSYCLTLVFRDTAGIPMLINNLKIFDRRAEGEFILLLVYKMKFTSCWYPQLTRV